MLPSWKAKLSHGDVFSTAKPTSGLWHPLGPQGLAFMAQGGLFLQVAQEESIGILGEA